jgi:diketogulonate reductase-like aldo/keto reductase
LLAIGKKYGKSPAQILIRWGLQHNIIQIPKSANENHIAENIDVFDFVLNENDIKELDNLNEDHRINPMGDPEKIK